MVETHPDILTKTKRVLGSSKAPVEEPQVKRSILEDVCGALDATDLGKEDLAWLLNALDRLLAETGLELWLGLDSASDPQVVTCPGQKEGPSHLILPEERSGTGQERDKTVRTKHPGLILSLPGLLATALSGSLPTQHALQPEPYMDRLVRQSLDLCQDRFQEYTNQDQQGQGDFGVVVKFLQRICLHGHLGRLSRGVGSLNY